MTLQETITASAEYLRTHVTNRPTVALVLGSGLGDFADTLENPVRIPYKDIPNFPQTTVAGHNGAFVFGRRCGREVVALQGRLHYYEGYSQQTLTLPVRVLAAMGVKQLVLTNAAGGVNTSFSQGCLMLISDHINYSGQNPLIGPNLDAFGPRFPDVSDLYTAELRTKIKAAAAAAGIPLEEGVYMMFTGPSFETPAEIRMAACVGADAVGMSTVPEAIVAAHCGIKVLGISCISNYAAGIVDQPLSHLDVTETTERVKNTFKALIDLILEKDM